MKKINLLLILAFTLFITSCDKDEEIIEDPTGPITGNLAGVWIGTDVDYSGVLTMQIAGQDVDQDFVGTGYDIDFTATFESNPNRITSDGTYSVEVITSLLGQSIKFNDENVPTIPSSNWSRVANDIQFPIENGDPVITSIMELTDTTLKLKVREEKDLAGVGVAGTTAKVDVIYIFTRQ